MRDSSTRGMVSSAEAEVRLPEKAPRADTVAEVASTSTFFSVSTPRPE